MAPTLAVLDLLLLSFDFLAAKFQSVQKRDSAPMRLEACMLRVHCFCFFVKKTAISGIK